MSTVKIVTFNSRNTWMWSKEGVNCFIFRAGLIYEKVNNEQPDVIAFQEILEKNLGLLQKMLPEYEFYGQFRNADFTGEGLYTAVKKSEWSVIAYETFWISPTPYVPGSRFEDQSDCPRICVVTQLRHKKTGKMLRLYNIHLDHVSDHARIEGIKCVLAKMEEYNAKVALPSMIMGDFNALPDSETMRFCNEHKNPVIRDVTGEIEMTYHGYGTDSQKIDYIYVTEDVLPAVEKTELWPTKYNGIYISDHYPVCTYVDLDKL
ncbi:MAG: endonuclease/exonuclease/phosphatase family protein [Clostridia bacterium]|nr:endonuclease/exonuclease/phosphatase family protein [Clostridia bacterium]